jgi:hypothetical protein
MTELTVMKAILMVIITANIAAVITTVGSNSNGSCDNVDKTIKLDQMCIYILETK